MVDSYDLIAIGAGPARESATELAFLFGHRSAIVEKNRPGGTVTTTGGAPTKTLRESALYVAGVIDGDVYGLRVSAPEVSTDITRRRTWAVCEPQKAGIERALAALREVDGGANSDEGSGAPATRKGGISPEGKRRLIAALKKGWAAKKVAAQDGTPVRCRSPLAFTH